MKYVNPGFPQLFDYQNLNDIVVGIDRNYEFSQTGFYLNISRSDNDIFYKVIEPTKEFYLLFDMILSPIENIETNMQEFVPILDFYNDADPSKSIKLCYKQQKENIYLLGFFTNNNQIIGNIMQIQRSEFYTIELHVIRGYSTTIEFFLNNKLKQSLLDSVMGNDIVNRINFYCNYVTNMNVCLSHFIYNDTSKIGNERIKMLRTDMSQRIIPNGTTANFLITEILNKVMYKDITGFGIVSSVENTDVVQTGIKQFLNANKLDEFVVDSNKTKYDLTYINNDPQTNKPFVSDNVTNRKVVMETTRIE